MADDGPGRVRVRVHGDLRFFTDAAEQDVPVGAPRSVKDLLESLGVPHPEIDLVVVDGEVVGFDRPVTAGDRVAAYPPWPAVDLPSPVRPPRPASRFVLDVHLGTLARRLGVLGLDVDYATDRDDAALHASRSPRSASC
ncbi:MAG: MoaD/ThiS family protein [Bacteroidales bacterium]|nr:MoaD/ThiS family protein [Bacteroidales bacterium]